MTLLPDRVDIPVRYTESKTFALFESNAKGIKKKMVRTLSRMSDISVKLIVKRGFIVCIISKKKRGDKICYATLRTTKNKKTCMRTDATEERRVKRRKKDGKGGTRTYKECEIAKYDKDVLESTAGSLAVVTF